MKVLVAPDKFKGSITATEFCIAARKGIIKMFPEAEVLQMPLSDGGDGLCEALFAQGDYNWHYAKVLDPLFREIEVRYLADIDQRKVVLEMAAASGLVLLDENERNCMDTSSIGTGQLIKHVISKGAENIILGLGGSATNDGGIGLAAGLGFRFFDKQDNELLPTGRNMINIHRIDPPDEPLFIRSNFTVLTDVTNVMHGLNGAAYTYAAQKGAENDEIELLDKGLKHLALKYEQHFSIDPAEFSGSGAAGGLGSACAVLFQAELVSGADYLLELFSFDKKCRGADLVITGEGSFDEQSLNGKLPLKVATKAKAAGVPVALITGHLEPELVLDEIFDWVKTLDQEASSKEEAMQQAKQFITSLSYDLMEDLNNDHG